MLSESWWSCGWETVHPNWLSQNAAGFVCKETPLGLDWLGGWGRGGSPERAGTCPVLRVCHPQLEHRPFPKLITELYSYDCEWESRAARNMNKRDEVVLNVCWKMMNWFDQIISKRLGRQVKASVKQMCLIHIKNWTGEKRNDTMLLKIRQQLSEYCLLVLWENRSLNWVLIKSCLQCLDELHGDFVLLSTIIYQQDLVLV